jgi:hypothetical protein
MFNTLEEISNNYNISFDTKELEYETHICFLFNKNDFINALCNLALFYNENTKNDDLIKKYYLMAIDKGCDKAMYLLSHYYFFTEINIDLMIKYGTMAADNGNISSMYVLGMYYYSQKINYSLMKKYLLMAIDKGCHKSMLLLGNYYSNNIEDGSNDLMKQYYLMAIDKGNINAMCKLSVYYKEFEDNEELSKKYNLMALDALKKSLKFTSNDECIICLDTKDLYENNCERHSVCIECQYQIKYVLNEKKCSYCRQLYSSNKLLKLKMFGFNLEKYNLV